MATVLCAIDGGAASEEALRGAVSDCRARGAKLHLLGVVATPRLEAPSPAYGERVRRFQDVEYALVHGARAARAAGLSPTISIRAGDLAAEALAEARRVGATEALLAREHGLLRRRLEVERLAFVVAPEPVGLRPAAA